MNSKTIRQSSPPLPLIIFDILICLRITWWKGKPIKFPFTMFFTIHKLPQIQVPIWINFNSTTIFLIAIKLTLIDSTLLRNINTFPISFFIFHNSKINLTVIFNQFKIGMIEYFLHVKIGLREQMVICKKITKLLLIHHPYIL